MKLPTKLDLLLLWEAMGSTDVPPAVVSKDCFLFGQEIGKELLFSQLPVGAILSRFAFIESAGTDFEKSVRLGMFSIIERNLESIKVEMSDVADFIDGTISSLPLTPPNRIYYEKGYSLLQHIHQALQNGIYPRRELEMLCAIIDDIEGDEKTYNMLDGCRSYLQKINSMLNL